MTNILDQIQCCLPKPLGEALFNILEDDVLSVSLDEESPTQWMLKVIVNPSTTQTVRDRIISHLTDHQDSLPEITLQKLPPTDWVKAVEQDLHPLTLGKFYIYGSHTQTPPPSDLHPLHIDAATAFGSGHHESTEGCLKALTWLDTHTSFERPLDMGCGSGILSLAMARLWAVPVLACDNDPEAVRVTSENAERNSLSSLIKAELREGFAALPKNTFDIITANILAGPLSHMAPDALETLCPKGILILSGLLNRQAEDVIDAYRSAGAVLVEQLFVGEWTTLIMRKKANG